jgi:hypothetical protein
MRRMQKVRWISVVRSPRDGGAHRPREGGDVARELPRSKTSALAHCSVPTSGRSSHSKPAIPSSKAGGTSVPR